jgi:EmrB/QacA subfamily drug resistance transporter
MKSEVPRRVLVPLIVACALFMENLDSTVIATALPEIARSMGENPLHLSLAITSYLLSLAVFIPASGWAADRFGARVIFRAAIVVFVLGSVLCGLSQTMYELVGARILQGIGGAMMVPIGRLVILRSVSKSELVSAMAYLTVPALLGPVVGPPIGGFIATYGAWQWIFFINVPIGIVGFVLVSLFIDEVKEPGRPRFDTLGWTLAGLGLAALVFGFENIGRGLLPNAAVIALLSAGAALLVAYVAHMRRVARPILDLTLLKIPTYGASIAGGFLFRIGIGALPFLLPLMLQLGFGLTPFQSGLLTLSGAIGAIVMKTVVGTIVRQFGFRNVLIVNSVICGLFLMANGLFTPATPHWLILAVLLVGGLFRSLQFTSVNTMGYADVSDTRMSSATSLSSTAQQLSVSFGVGTGALILHLTLASRGAADLSAGDFWPAFVIIGLISMASALVFLPLPADAGASVSGKPEAAKQPAE